MSTAQISTSPSEPIVNMRLLLEKASAFKRPLMIAVGFSGLLKALAFSNNSLMFTIGSLGEVLIWAVLIHLLLSFPAGRLEGGVDRLIVAVGYFNATVVQVAGLVLTDPVKAGCADCPANLLLI